MKKYIAVVLIVLLICATSITAFAESIVFDDVPDSHWAYSAIEKMTEIGLLKGVGDGLFAPDKEMTRAEFLTIIVRYLYPDEDTTPTDNTWYSGYYNIAVEKEIVKKNDFRYEGKPVDLTVPMTRQEMAYVLINAYEKGLNNTVSKLVPTIKISDWDSIGTYYRKSVQKAYSLGLLVGIDNIGTFAPQNTLSRCQAATVIYRLLDESTRQKVDFSPVVKTDSTTYNEGQTRSNMPAVGDTVIKADGTKVVLEEKWGVLGAGQGVDIYSGIILENGTHTKAGETMWVDRSGLFTDYRGEVHSGYQWNYLKDVSYPDHKGQNGEICNNWWQYEDGWGWNWIGPVGD